MRTVVCLIAAVLALELPAPALQDGASKFVMGVLRRDGVVVPFAAYDGRRWRGRWPDDIRSRELPISLESVPEDWWGIEPAPRTMSIWRDGARVGSLNLTGVAMTPLMCEPRITVRSDYKPATPAPPPFEVPYPKDGVVISGSATLERIEPVEKGSADWNRIVIAIEEEFNREETAAAREFSSWSHPVSTDRRKLVPIGLEALYRAPMRDEGWTAFYVEAVREYAPSKVDRDGCGLATFGHGWVLVRGNDIRLRLTAKVTYCDRKGVSYMLPFGVIRSGNRIFWVYQFSGFEEEWYEVVEPTRGGVESHVAYRAGGC